MGAHAAATPAQVYDQVEVIVEFNRRSFIKGAAGVTLLAATPLRSLGASQRFPGIPSLQNLASVPMPHPFLDLFNLPIAMNDLGYAQCVKSVTGISAIAFPPYACCGAPDVPWSPGLLITCEMFVNDRLIATGGLPEDAVTYTWYPHRVVREQNAAGLNIRSHMFLAPGERAVAQTIEIKNTSGAAKDFRIGFDMRAATAKGTGAWLNTLPGEGGNTMSWDASAGALTFKSVRSGTTSTQGLTPKAHRLAGGRVLEYDLHLAPGQTQMFHYVNAIAPDSTQAQALYRHLQDSFDAADQANEQEFERLVRSAFTPGNSDFSGHLPQLNTDSESLWNLYQNGFKNLLTARRRSPDSAYGPALLTLSGHVLPTLTFPWDTALSSLSLALLDPAPLRNVVEIWFQRDMHKHLATDYISGQAVGPWYAVNDMAIIRCAQDYLRVTGDMAWLDKKIEGKTVLDYLEYHALYWKNLRTTSTGLADYGGIENLLELVSTYTHEVAGMNAGNVRSMRFLAELRRMRGDPVAADKLDHEASDLAATINRLLYVDGKGWWKCGQPDGTFNEVRHCYDFLAVIDNMSSDLSAKQKQEMAHFFWEQLASKKWMRALASGDPDATWNIRPDHSCIGAYPAWPPMSAKGLYKFGDAQKTAAWLQEVSKAGNQGPIGQAHFTEDVHAPLAGGAYKVSQDAPFITDWCCISAGAFTDLVIDSIFGVDLVLQGPPRATPQLAGFDATAELRGVRHRDGHFDVTAKGVTNTKHNL
jgi:hypothetical protein